HSTEKSVPEQKTKETGAEKACRKSAKQSSAKEARSSRRLSDRTGLAGLRYSALFAWSAAPKKSACLGFRPRTRHRHGHWHRRRQARVPRQSRRMKSESGAETSRGLPQKMARIQYVWRG